MSAPKAIRSGGPDPLSGKGSESLIAILDLTIIEVGLLDMAVLLRDRIQRHALIMRVTLASLSCATALVVRLAHSAPRGKMGLTDGTS
jgi:hypothetical protein